MFWDSGKVATNQSTNVPYGGPRLTSITRYFWTVTYWDSSGQQSPTSDMAFFQTGLMDGEEDWVFADWLDGEKGNQLRTEFEIDKPVSAAFLYIVGLGYYQARINGQQVGDHVLGPFTTFEYRLLYDAHDVTDLIRFGQNALSVTLGHGWYAQPSVKVGGRSLRCIMFIFFEGGGGFPVKSSKDSWKQTDGPIVVDDIYIGETYNASMETPGWDMPGYNDSHWANATALKTLPTGSFSAHMMPHAKKVDTYSALNITQPGPGVFVFDFGQNMAGFCTLHLDQPGQRGTNITLLHAEMMFENGFVQHRYSNSPELTVYIFSGDEDTIEFEPRFTYYGFRYVQITGFPGAPDHQSLVAHFVHTAVDEESSIVFSEDHNILNGAQHITRFASLSNFISIPTDCPQRERRGWLGDAQLSAEFTIHNFDMAASYTKFLRDINDTQLFVATENKGDGAVPDCVPWYHHGGLPSDPAWGVAYTLLTYWMYHYYGTK
jgi:alpha-L-rhamnosidase